MKHHVMWSLKFPCFILHHSSIDVDSAEARFDPSSAVIQWSFELPLNGDLAFFAGNHIPSRGCVSLLSSLQIAFGIHFAGLGLFGCKTIRQVTKLIHEFTEELTLFVSSECHCRLNLYLQIFNDLSEGFLLSWRRLSPAWLRQLCVWLGGGI